MNKLFIIISVLMVGSQSYAGKEKGGGIGILSGSNVYLADFVEAGLEDSAVLPTDVPELHKVRYKEIKERVAKKIPFLTAAEIEAISLKFLYVGFKDWVFANSLLLQWKDISGDKLISIL